MLSSMASQEEASGLPSVLVVEDEILIRSAAAEFLRGAGYKVIEAANGEEAIAVCASGTPVDLVFSDINMPGDLDGVELARRIADRHPGIHIILTSAIGQARRAREIGATFLPKPYRLAEAAHRIGALLNHPPRDDA